MVQALVELSQNTNRVLNIIKAKYELKDKGEAIEALVSEYIELKQEPELRPEYVKKLKKIMRGKYVSGEKLEKALREI
ncbi:DUF2683 family protein [Candidatus Woesearchaeota archaeon]|jgi:biotin operon repressor|nr:DUF2683 family protein [Candidatus Woesearchaeota archaeon]